MTEDGVDGILGEDGFRLADNDGLYDHPVFHYYFHDDASTAPLAAARPFSVPHSFNRWFGIIVVIVRARRERH